MCLCGNCWCCNYDCGFVVFDYVDWLDLLCMIVQIGVCWVIVMYGNIDVLICFLCEWGVVVEVFVIGYGDEE